jgi:outer membrane translocation and assembly module TamA
MKLSSRATTCSLTFLFALINAMAVLGLVRSVQAEPTYPAHLPYRFSNIVWWSDEDLRVLLKKRIPGLGDELPTTHAAEGKVRDALTALLKEKGIAAEVQSEEPSPSALTRIDPALLGAHPPEVPRPAIEFSLLMPKILIGKTTFQDVPRDTETALETEIEGNTGRPYNAFYKEFQQERLARVLAQQGYLEAQVTLRAQPPQKNAESYQVDLLMAVISGPKYHIASIKADGGPLLAGKDLSRFFNARPGDVAKASPFAALGPQIRSFYAQQGYADVNIESEPALDREHALASYHLTVKPGPQYHLRSLKIENVSPEQEAKIKELLGMKVGDVFNEDNINQLYRKVPSEPALKGMEFNFGPKRDPATAAVDLTLTFSKSGGEATVTTH